MINMNEAVLKIKAAGSKAVRVVPGPGQSVDSGLYQIEILESSGWSPVVQGLAKQVAESMVNQAVNRVILG
jgi:hypothetical protein